MRCICVAQLAQTANIHEMRLFIARHFGKDSVQTNKCAHPKSQKQLIFI